MLDTVFWAAVSVALFFGILLICIDLLEEWEHPACSDGDVLQEVPAMRLKRLARQLERTRPDQLMPINLG